MSTPTDTLYVEFCGEITQLRPGQEFAIGRDADLSVDDNPFLHRRIVLLSHEVGFWWVTNVGSRLPVTVSGEAGSLHAFVPPGSRIPVALPTLSILFTAGETTYEVSLRAAVPAFEATAPEPTPGDSTLGVVPLTTTQFRLLLALAENVLRRIGTGAVDIPSNAAAAERLGWSLTTFNRKLDNVCEKYDRAGVKGLRGGRDGLASNRRSRLVEYVVAARIVRPEHLPLLDNSDDTAEVPT